MTTLRNDPLAIAVDTGLANKLAEQDVANGMGDLRRGWNSGRIANDLNPLLVDQNAALANGDVNAAAAMAPQIKSLRERQQMYAPRVGQVEKIGGIGDALDWAAGQVGQGAASMADPMAVSAGLGTVGRIANAIPHPIARGIGTAATAGSLAVPYLMNQRQLAGEFLGNAEEDKDLMARSTPQQLRDTSQAYGAAAAVLDTALPGILGHQVAGTTARTALGKLPFGAKVAGEMLGEGGTEALQEKGSQFALGTLNPNRDTSGDNSAVLNSFLGGAVGAGPMIAGGAAAEAGHNRLLDGADRVKSAAGTVLDLAKDGIDAAGAAAKPIGKILGKGKDKVIDMGEDVVNSLKEGSQNLKTWAQTTAEEAHVLQHFVPPGVDAATMNEDQLAEAEMNRAKLVMDKLQGAAGEGDQRAAEMFNDIQGEGDPVAGAAKMDAAAKYVLDNYMPVGRTQQRAQDLMRSAGKFASAGFGTAVKLGKEFMGGLKEGNKKNAMGEESAPLNFMQWRDEVYGTKGQELADSAFKRSWDMVKAKDTPEQKQWVDSVDYMASVAEDLANKAKGTKLKYGEVAKRMAFNMASAIESAASVRTETGNVGQNQIDRLASEFMDLYGPKAPDAVVQLGSILGNTASPVTQRIVASMQALAGPQGRAQAAMRRDVLGRDVAAMVPLSHRKELLSQGINIEDAGGREALLNVMEDLADGVAHPGVRKKAEELFSAEGVHNMLGILNDVAVAKNKEHEEAKDRGELVDMEMESQLGDEADEGDEGATGTEKHIHEFAVARASGDRIYAFHGSKDHRLSGDRRDPLAPTKRATTEEKADAAIFGEPAPVHRPKTFYKGMGLSDELMNTLDTDTRNELKKHPLGVAIAKKVKDLEQELRMDPEYQDHDNYRVEPISVKQLLDEVGAHPLKRLQMARDYQTDMVKELEGMLDKAGVGERAGALKKRIAEIRDLTNDARYLLAENYRAHLIAQAKKNGAAVPAFSGYTNPAIMAAEQRFWEALDVERNGTEGKAGNPALRRLPVREAAEVFREQQVRNVASKVDELMSKRYAVRAEKISDANPDMLTPADIMKMHRDGQRGLENARGTTINGKFEAVPIDEYNKGLSDRNILMFLKDGKKWNDRDSQLSIPAGKLVEWVRRTGQGWEPTKGKNGEVKADPDKAYLHDLSTGIMAVYSTGKIAKGTMPYKLNARGERESFDNTVPDSLALPTTTYFGYKKKQENRAEWKQAQRDKETSLGLFPKEGVNERLKNGTMTANERRAREADAYMVNSRQDGEAVARDQMRRDDWFVADPTEGFSDEFKEDKTNRLSRAEMAKGKRPDGRRKAAQDKWDDRLTDLRLPDSQTNEKARASRAWDDNEFEPEDITPLDRYKPEQGDEFSEHRARSDAQKFSTESVLRGETRANVLRTAEARGMELMGLVNTDPEAATEAIMTRVRMAQGKSQGGLKSGWWHVAPVAMAAASVNWQRADDSVKEMMGDVRAQIARTLLDARKIEGHDQIKPAELVAITRLMATDPKKITGPTVVKLLEKIAAEEGGTDPEPPQGPTRKRTEDLSGTYPKNPVRFKDGKAASEVAAKGPKGQQTSSGAAKANAQDEGPSRIATEEEMKEARAYVMKVLGPKIKVLFKDNLGYSGEFLDAENTIVVSTTAAAGTMGTTYHEALHAFFRDFVKSNPELQATFEAVINSPKIVARLQDLLKDHPAALEQLKDGEERLAYTYQFWKAGLIEIDTRQHNIFQKIGAFFRRVLGMVRDSERALEIFTAFDNGKMSEPSAAGEVIAAAMQKGTNALKFRQKYDGLLTNLAGLVVPSAEVLLRSESATAQKLGRILFTNPGEESHNGEPGMLNAKRTEAQRYINEVNRRLESMSDADRKRVHAYLEQEEIELNDIPLSEDREAVRHIRGVLARFHTYLTDSGMNIGKVKNYFPVVWSQSALMTKRQEFIDMLVTKYAHELAPINGDLNAAADRIWATLVDKEGVDTHFTAQREDGVLTPFFASQGNRTLSFLKGSDRSQFLEKNLPLILTRYFHQGAHSAEYFRRFGEDGVKLDGMLKTIGAELRTESQRLLQRGQIKDEKARKLWVDRRMREINRSVGAMEGTLGKDVSPAMRKFNSWMTVYQNVRLLPLALFSSLVDPLAIVARGAPLQAAFETLVYGLKEVFAQWKAAFSDMPPERQADAWRDLAEHIGAAEIAVFQHHVSEEYSSSYLTPGAKKINDIMFKLNGMEAWNRGTRVMATKWAVKFLEDHAKGVDPIHSERFLKELGLTKDQVPLNADGKLITTPQELRDAKGITLEKARWELAPIYDALNRWVEGAVLTPNAAQRPAWSSDPRYSTIFHLKQFTYSFHQTILKRARNELEHGNLKPVAALALFVPTMIASDITKGFLQGAGTLPPYMQGMNAGDWLAHGVNRAGLAGIGVIGTDAYNDWASLGGPAFEQIVDASRDGFGATTAMKAMPVHAMYEHLVT